MKARHLSLGLTLLGLSLAAAGGAAAQDDLESAAAAHHSHPPHGIYLESRGIKLEYLESGQRLGHPVIFLHGYTDSWFSFSRVLALLPPEVHGYYLSQRGHGDSDKPACCYTQDDFVADVLAFMDQKGIAKATVVGHSMGSFIAHQLALEAPERVEGLVLVGSSPAAGNPVLADFNLFVQGLDEITPEFAREFQQGTLCVPVPERFLDKVVGESLKVPLHVWKEALQGLVDEDHGAALEDVLVPTLVSGGMKDAFFPVDDQLSLATTVAHGDTVFYADLCHAPHWEEPGPFTEDLVQFLRREVWN